MDFDKTQGQLLLALDQVTSEKLQGNSGEKTIGEHITFYNSHETCHAGQLEILRQVINRRNFDTGVKQFEN
jgi:hypothetical protein